MHNRPSDHYTLRPWLPQGLMPHQDATVRRAVTERRYLIAHEQGTGKTITGIALAKSALLSGISPVLVVCPPSLVFNWTNEFAKWAPTVTTTILKNRQPLDREEAPWVGLPKVDVIIATDGALKGYNRWFIGGEQKFTWDDESAMDDFGNRIIPNYFQRDFGPGVGALIVDECQRVSNGRAGRGVAFTHLCAERPLMPKFLLSGTPFTKTRVGLYSLLRGLDRFDAHHVDGAPADAKTWLDYFAPVADSYGSRGQAHTEELSEQMFAHTGWADRVRAVDVLDDLPNMGRIQQAAELRGEWARKYAKAERDLEAWLIETRGSERAEVLMRVEALFRVQELRRLVGKAKLESAIERIALTMGEGDETEPVLVFCTHDDTREAILTHFAKAGFRTATIYGGMSAHQKQAVVDAWQAGDLDLVVANVISASVGFTMTAGRHCVFAELPWNACDILQAESRLLRKGQEREVCSQVLVGVKANGTRTVDDRLWAKLEGKFREAKGVLDGEDVLTMVGEDEESIAMSILRSYLADLD